MATPNGIVWDDEAPAPQADSITWDESVTPAQAPSAKGIVWDDPDTPTAVQSPAAPQAPAGRVEMIGGAPATPRQEVQTVAVNSAPGVGEDPRFLGAEGENSYVSLARDPNVSWEQVNDFLRQEAINKGHPAQDIMVNQSDLLRFREQLAKDPSAPIGAVTYSDWKEPLQPGNTLSEKDGIGTGILRSLQQGIQEAGVGLMGRTIADWTDVGGDIIDAKFPNATAEQREELQEEFVNWTQRKVREANELEIADDGLVPWLIGQVLTPDPVDLLPIGRGAKALSRLGRVGEKVAEGAVLNSAMDVGYQAVDQKAGIQDEFSGTRALAAGAFGGVLHGGIQGGAELIPSRMNFEGKAWNDTNYTSPEQFEEVTALLRSGKAPKSIFEAMGGNLPQNPRNIAALRTAREELAAGRDPQASLDQLQFRPQGLTVEKTLDAINEHTKDWTNSPEIIVHDSFDSDTIPPEMQGRVDKGTLGWKDENGGIHIVASQHATPEAVTATLFHEGMHSGMARAYQTGLQDKLVTLYDNANSNFKKALQNKEDELAATDDRWKDLSPDEKKELVVDEVLASASEHGLYKEPLDSVSRFIRGFGRRHLGEIGKKIKYSDAEIREIMSTGYSHAAHGEGDMGPLRYMYAGAASETADLNKMNQSMKRNRAGEDPEQVRKETGWHKGADNNWRYEMTDESFQFPMFEELKEQAIQARDKKFTEPHPSMKAKDVFYHPELFKAYPELGDIDVIVKPDLWDFNQVTQGWMSVDGKTLAITPYAENPRETALHELQHAVQQIEGFAGGGNPETAISKIDDDVALRAAEKIAPYAETKLTPIDNKIKAFEFARNDPTLQEITARLQSDNPEERLQASQDLKELFGVSEWDEQLWELESFLRKSEGSQTDALAKMNKERQRLIDSINGMDDAVLAKDPDMARKALAEFDETHYPAYRALHGEVEARDTASRADMNAEDRKKVRPLSSTEPEVLPDEFIFTYPGRDKDVRFSRKYSDVFPKNYEGRLDRTENISKAHFGNFAINNLKGMMRPLEQYNRLSDEDIREAAQTLKDQGFNAEIAIAQGAIPDNSGFVVALKDLVRDKLETASEVAGRYRKSGGQRHERELMRALTELGQVFTVFDKTASNLGRMLYSLNLRLDAAKGDDGVKAILDRVRFANGTLDAEAMDEIAQALISKDPRRIRRSVDKFDSRWKTIGTSLYYNYLLGSSTVQLGNITGNATRLAQSALNDILGYGVGLGRAGVAKVKGKSVDRMHSDELVSRLSGVLGGLLNQKTYTGSRAWNNAAKEFMIPAGQEEHLNKFASQGIKNLPLSILLEYGTRGIQGTDAFFRTVFEHAAMQGLATREARKLNGGRKPSPEQIAEVMAFPTQKMLTQVKTEADRMLFQEDPFLFGSNFSKTMRQLPGGFLVAPFIRTPANIGRSAFEAFDPTGRITKRNRETLKAGGPDADRVRGGQLLAAALWAGALGLISEDLLHGGGPKNAQARAQWLMKYKPYTIGKGDDAIPLRTISPIGDGLAMIADGVFAIKNGSKPDAKLADTSLDLAGAMSNAVLTNSFVSSTTDSIDRGVEPSMQNILGTLTQAGASVPVYSQYRKETDPYIRDTRNADDLGKFLTDKASLMDNPASSFFGTMPRDELPVQHDIFGRKIRTDKPTSPDPVAQEVGRLVEATGKSVVPGFDRESKGVKVPNEVYQNFLEIAGPPMRQVVSEIMNDPTYKKTTNDEQRAALIRSNKTLKGLRGRLSKQLDQMMLDRDPAFEDKFIPEDKKVLMTIPGEEE